MLLLNIDTEIRTTSAPTKCIDQKHWCKDVSEKKCWDPIYDYDDEKDDLFQDVCKKLCDNC